MDVHNNVYYIWSNNHSKYIEHVCGTFPRLPECTLKNDDFTAALTQTSSEILCMLYTFWTPAPFYDFKKYVVILELATVS